MPFKSILNKPMPEDELLDQVAIETDGGGYGEHVQKIPLAKSKRMSLA